MTEFDYVTAMDPEALRRDYPIGEAFTAQYTRLSRDALRARQERDFAAVMAFAWRVPFYQRIWGAKGIQPGDIRSLDDLPKLPSYDKSDIMAAVAAHPPLGDHHGQDAHPPGR